MLRKSSRSLAFVFPLVALLGCGGVENVGDSPDALDADSEAEVEASRAHPLLEADTDGNGLLSKTEFIAAQDARFAKADADKDGVIAGAELAALKPEHRGKGPWGKGKGKGPDGKGRMDPEARFAAADTNADGVLIKAEVETQAATKFAELDANGDGTLGEDERPFKHGPDKDVSVDKTTFVAKAWERISAADANGDGQVTKDELRAAGPKMMGKGRGGPMAKVDADGNGAISKAEFAAMGDKMWAHLDADQSGSLEPAELKRGKRPHGAGRGER